MSSVDVRWRGGVLCAGALVLDTLVRPFHELHWGTTTLVESIETRVGGSAANTARALGILGVPVRVAAALGRDHAAELILKELIRCGVDTSALQRVEHPSPQTIALINSNGNRQFLHRRGCSDIAFHKGLEFTPENMRDMSHFHVASLFVVPHLRTEAPIMLRDARCGGLTTSLDTSWDPEGEWMRVLKPCLPHLDILFMNDDEAAHLRGSGSIEDLLRTAIGEGTRMVVTKQGPQGCRVFSSSVDVLCPAYEVEVRDTTGAGDCFVAGFLAGYLGGASAEEAGRMGNAAGALSVREIGAVEGLVSRSEQERWMGNATLRHCGD